MCTTIRFLIRNPSFRDLVDLYTMDMSIYLRSLDYKLLVSRMNTVQMEQVTTGSETPPCLIS